LGSRLEFNRFPEGGGRSILPVTGAQPTARRSCTTMVILSISDTRLCGHVVLILEEVSR